MKICLVLILLSVSAYSQLAGTPGAFTRIGFGTRGIALGNAMSAVRSGEISGFYNPSVITFSRENYVSVSYGILSLDRSHNSIFCTLPIDSNASISFAVLNSGVSDIDGRDIDGFHTEMYSTSENLFSFSFGMRIRKISIGVSPKIYYYSLFKDLSFSSLGVDVGISYPLTSNITIGAVMKDFNSKYEWNSTPLYDELGNTTTEKFPVRRAFGVSYVSDQNDALLTAEIEASNKKTTIIRFGGEYAIVEQFIVRAGVDGWNSKEKNQAHPSFGFTILTEFMERKPALNYTFTSEPYGLFSIHFISLSVIL